jgi:hypothetical protein
MAAVAVGASEERARVLHVFRRLAAGGRLQRVSRRVPPACRMELLRGRPSTGQHMDQAGKRARRYGAERQAGDGGACLSGAGEAPQTTRRRGVIL